MKIINGKEVSLAIEKQLIQEVEALKAMGKRIPKLAVILVGEDPASQTYVGSKEKACTRVGFLSEVIKMDKESCTQDVIKEVQRLNKDKDVDGILVQLPLPKQCDSKAVILALDPSKDVDGLHPINIAKLYAKEDGFVPCTPKGIMTLLDIAEVKIEGSNAVVIGRSDLVGRPIAQLLLNKNATVTTCHSKTKDIPLYTKQADIIVVAIGRPNYLDKSYIEKEAVIIDVGINRVEGKLVGDVDYDSVFDFCKAITPVPKGVGPMTIVSLLENTLIAYKKRS